ncbi:Zn-dependent dipeptidase, microsomal dipeptidase [Acetomicrobium mobile DSM 13181]|uniref:Zn-dependent dipeptidase, microsomal dipeptidase n=1 Tax=Acetomicrobium mobile (strain ATCC BAA-54 / DSM 13181 / JCM 12221 / NGA) TaxID=891968 RepID=I4BWI6_ACEMN|nr:membrane dipeptidase [Acetomicrobium mobile]AFM21643.1 Zn-dependent dipeptidase, microsomal dipeptidase [Acetomicrobium mobile DSM 13181]
MTVNREHIEMARALHEKHFVSDAHFDLLPLIWDRRQRGETKVMENRYIPAFRQGGVNLIVSSLFVSNEYLPEMALRRALDYIGVLHDEIEESPGLFSLCRSVKEIKEANSAGMVAIVLSFEGVEPIGNDLNLLRIFYELGVRGVGIAWSRRNYAADGCHFEAREEGQRGGITDFGVKLIREAEKLGMYIDVSHLNDEGLSDVLKFYDKAVIASHSNCRNLARSMRNLTDEQILQIAQRGGLMGMNSCSEFVKDAKEKIGAADLADHIEHIYKITGSFEHVCYGFDFCDEFRELSPSPKESPNYDCIKGHARSFELTAELIARGVKEEDIAKIIGGNFLRFLERTIG